MSSLDGLAGDQRVLDYLAKRVGRLYLKQRLGLETDYEARMFRKGTHFFHLENVRAANWIIKNCLRLAGLYRRGRRNSLDIRVRRNDVALEGLPPAFDGYTILHISDPHVDMSEDITRALIERVRAVSYDLCVLTGDYRARTYGPWAATLEWLRQVRLHLKDPVYGVLGNHDTLRMVPDMEAMGIRMLLNEWVTIERAGAAIYLAGIDDAHYYRVDNLEKAADDIPSEAVSILLSHTPETYRHAAHSDFSLMLCGHTHGGQICLPGGLPLMTDADCPRQLVSGPWTYHGLRGYTSVGAGSSVVPVRFNCPPEITLHHLHRVP
jgi:predicted MPP superfamily phosphohydrolase